MAEPQVINPYDGKRLLELYQALYLNAKSLIELGTEVYQASNTLGRPTAHLVTANQAMQAMLTALVDEAIALEGDAGPRLLDAPPWLTAAKQARESQE